VCRGITAEGVERRAHVVAVPVAHAARPEAQHHVVQSPPNPQDART
jgi:hypothetical protein